MRDTLRVIRGGPLKLSLTEAASRLHELFAWWQEVKDNAEAEATIRLFWFVSPEYARAAGAPQNPTGWELADWHEENNLIQQALGRRIAQADRHMAEIEKLLNDISVEAWAAAGGGLPRDVKNLLKALY